MVLAFTDEMAMWVKMAEYLALIHGVIPARYGKLELVVMEMTTVGGIPQH
jgi:hypothetical protein